MSTATMKTRLDRIEEAVMPKPQQKVCVLMAPSPRASHEEVAAHEAKLAAATAAGEKVLVIELIGMTRESVRLKAALQHAKRKLASA